MFNLNGQKKCVSWKVQIQISGYQEIKKTHICTSKLIHIWMYWRYPGHTCPALLDVHSILKTEIIEIQILYRMYLFMSVSFYMAHLLDHRNSLYSWFKASSSVCVYIYSQSDFYYFLKEICITVICVGNPLAVPLLGFVMLIYNMTAY